MNLTPKPIVTKEISVLALLPLQLLLLRRQGG